jgi:hypothetical protein
MWTKSVSRPANADKELEANNGTNCSHCLYAVLATVAYWFFQTITLFVAYSLKSKESHILLPSNPPRVQIKLQSQS